MYIHLHKYTFNLNDIHMCIRLKYMSPKIASICKVYDTQLRLRSMDDEERIASLLEQTLRNTSSEGPSNRPITFVQTQETTSLEERVGE